MKAARLFAVIALGASAVLLAVWFLWFLSAAPPATAASTAQSEEDTAAPCDRIVDVRNGAALSNAFSVKLAAGDRLCLMRGGDSTVVYVFDGVSAGARLFSLASSLSDADLAGIGLNTTP
ncbi:MULTISPECIES: hypothetical protein [Microbacterium]|uniref:Uncharacterized protein n=1 Tax=Microbacterium hominis TaxID=162426 RepID=A0A2K9D6Z7_9MICO|nr:MULTISPECIES: hypothetical protein [Microbacterium]AUG29395.1 hypothetical protein CXR34_07945 [Microbacterium hominis]EPD84077.1 hypothetical protein HMPREF1529_02117 [Microbacterium sp. oral taxon 186 str. F0373]